MRTRLVLTAATLGLLASLVLAQGVAAKGLLSGALDTTTGLVTDTTGALTSTPTPATDTAEPPPSLTDTLTNSVTTVTDSVNKTVDDTVNTVVPSPVASPVTNLVDQTTKNVNDSVDTAVNNPTTQTVTTPIDQTVDTVTKTLDPVTKPVTDTVNQVTQPVVEVVDQTVQKTVDTVDQTLTTAPSQVLNQVGQTLPVTQPVIDTVTPLLPDQPVVAPLVDDATDTVNAIVNHDVAPVTEPVGGGAVGTIGDPIAPVTDPTTPANPTNPANPTTPIVPDQPVGNAPITGGDGSGTTPANGSHQPGGSLTQPAAPGATAPVIAIPTHPAVAQTPNGLAVDSQAGLPVTSATPAAPATPGWTLATTPVGSVAPSTHAALSASDWTTTVDTTAGTVLRDLARAAHKLHVSAPSLPLPVPSIPTPSFPTPSLPTSGSTLAGGASGGLSIGGSSGTAGFAAIVVMFMFALALMQRSLLARALEFPVSITHPVPTSPA